MTPAVVCAIIAWVLIDTFLLLAVVGFGIQDDVTIGSRVWAITGTFAVFFGVNAYALDQAGRYFGF